MNMDARIRFEKWVARLRQRRFMAEMAGKPQYMIDYSKPKTTAAAGPGIVADPHSRLKRTLDRYSDAVKTFDHRKGGRSIV